MAILLFLEAAKGTFPAAVFDAATKVTTRFGLGAFAIAAVVAIIFIIVNKGQANLVPAFAWVVLCFAVVVPIAAEVVIAFRPPPQPGTYRVTVTVLDPDGSVVKGVKITSSPVAKPTNDSNPFLFEIPPSQVPDQKMTFYAEATLSNGQQTNGHETADLLASLNVVLKLGPLQTTTPKVSPPMFTPYQSHFELASGPDHTWLAAGTATPVVDRALSVPADHASYFSWPSSLPSAFHAHFQFRLRKNQQSIGWLLRANRTTKSYHQITVSFTGHPPIIGGKTFRGGVDDPKRPVSFSVPELSDPTYFDGLVLEVDLIAEGCTFTHVFRFHGPGAAPLAPKEFKQATKAIGSDPRPVTVVQCENSGQFGFLADDEQAVLSIGLDADLPQRERDR